jgi:hypothetical protein
VTLPTYASNYSGNDMLYQFDDECTSWPAGIDQLDTDMKIVRASGIAALRWDSSLYYCLSLKPIITLSCSRNVSASSLLALSQSS